jgi:heptosyltransferase-2
VTEAAGGTATILVCRLSALGDVVLSLPVVDALRERFPHARLEHLARSPYHRVLGGVASLDAARAWEGPGHALPPEVADTRWDLVVDLSVTARSRRLLAGLRAGRRLRARKQTLRRIAFVRLRRIGGARPAIAAAVDRTFAALAPLGLSRAGRRPWFGVPAPPEDGPVLIAPGGGRDPKRWPVERFAAVARALVDAGDRLRLVGSAEERPLLERVGAGLPADRVETFAGPDLAELPRLAGGCPVAVTNDSGLLHVAEAAGASVVAIFGPTHPRLGFAPLDPASEVVQAPEPCRPCDVHGPRRCPLGHHRCMTEIPSAAVLDALARVRARRGERAGRAEVQR